MTNGAQSNTWAHNYIYKQNKLNALCVELWQRKSGILKWEKNSLSYQGHLIDLQGEKSMIEQKRLYWTTSHSVRKVMTVYTFKGENQLSQSSFHGNHIYKCAICK